MRLTIELRKYRDLDGAGRGEYFISMEKIFLPGGEIQDGHTKDAVKIAVHSVDRRLQLLPQNLLFLLRSFFLGTLLRETGYRGPNYDGEKTKTEQSFQHGDLRVSGDYTAECPRTRKSGA